MQIELLYCTKTWHTVLLFRLNYKNNPNKLLSYLYYNMYRRAHFTGVVVNYTGFQHVLRITACKIISSVVVYWMFFNRPANTSLSTVQACLRVNPLAPKSDDVDPTMRSVDNAQ